MEHSGDRSPIWWHLYPLGFLGAEAGALPPGSAAVSRLRALEPWLDHLVGLGCTGLLLGPVFAARTHGYDTTDHFAVDARLGDESDLRWLLDACHARGVEVLLDGVFHHVGRDFPGFREALAGGGPRAGWFRLRPDGSAPGGVTYDSFEGHADLVALDHTEPAVADHVVEVMTYWLAAGADGWRLDAAYAVPPRFWRDVVTRVRAKYPDARLFGEMIHGDYAGFVAATGLDGVTQYELWKAIWSSLNDRNMHELAWALERHDDLVPRALPMTFLGNHDVTRIATKIIDTRHRELALAVLMTVGGSPSVYAGDEQLLEGVKEDRAGGDDAIRPVFPADPADLGPAVQPVTGRSMPDVHRELIALRHRHPWLARARGRVTYLRNDVLVHEVSDGDRRLVLALNVARQQETGDLPAGSWRVELAFPGARVEGNLAVLPDHSWLVAVPA